MITIKNDSNSDLKNFKNGGIISIQVNRIENSDIIIERVILIYFLFSNSYNKKNIKK